jgi:thiosulfate/3-mercaptopyruvate sulfurtransferase
MSRGISFVFALAGIAPILSSAPATAQALVSTSWLRQHLNDTNIVVLDVYDNKDSAADFARGHIPSALFTAFLQESWRVQIGAAPGILPQPEDAAKLIGSYGIDNATHVVLVPGGRDKADFNATTRIYWTFKVLGDDNVSILDGGDKAWFADESNPVATGATTATPKAFVAQPRPELRAGRDDVKRAIRTQDAQLVDARPPAQYEGKVKSPVDRVAGTLPGAVNVPYDQLETADGTRLVDTATIDAVLAKAGAKTFGNQIVFCNTGHLASGTWFVLHEVKGNERARLYDGSMSDWTSDITLQVMNRPDD